MILKKKNLINFCHHFSTFLRFWALVINFDKINCYKMKWWPVEIIKQPCFVMYNLYFCHFKTYEKLHSAFQACFHQESVLWGKTFTCKCYASCRNKDKNCWKLKHGKRRPSLCLFFWILASISRVVVSQFGGSFECHVYMQFCEFICYFILIKFVEDS